MSRIISKTNYMKGLQCPKLLWTCFNDVEQIPETDAATQANFDEGHAVGRQAQALYPDGVLVLRDEEGFGAMLRRTQELLPQRRPIFEATFASGGCCAQADILNPVENGLWDLIEVKKSTSVKPQYYQDVAMQRHCYEGAGIPIRRCFLMHINNQYVRHGEVDPKGLLAAEDLTDAIAGILPTIPTRIAEMQEVIAQTSCPAVAVGPHCDTPYACPLKEICWAERGTGEEHVQPAGDLTCNCGAVQRFMGGLVYPLHLLDFETFMTAIPRFDNCRPYRQIPFQFSLHAVERLDRPPVHYSWLWDGAGDPRSIMLTELRRVIGATGSVMAYNKCFEEGCLCESAAAFPEHEGFIDDLMPRMVDLASPFRSHQVCHPAQEGSWSLKAVLPALTGLNYDDLAISDGGTASTEFMRVMFTEVAPEDRAAVTKKLEEYCGLDTYGMLAILRKLQLCSK